MCSFVDRWFFVFSSGLIGAGLSQFRSSTLKLNLPYFQRFRNPEDRQVILYFLLEPRRIERGPFVDVCLYCLGTVSKRFCA